MYFLLVKQTGQAAVPIIPSAASHKERRLHRLLCLRISMSMCSMDTLWFRLKITLSMADRTDCALLLKFSDSRPGARPASSGAWARAA